MLPLRKHVTRAEKHPQKRWSDTIPADEHVQVKTMACASNTIHKYKTATSELKRQRDLHETRTRERWLCKLCIRRNMVCRETVRSTSFRQLITSQHNMSRHHFHIRHKLDYQGSLTTQYIRSVRNMLWQDISWATCVVWQDSRYHNLLRLPRLW